MCGCSNYFITQCFMGFRVLALALEAKLVGSRGESRTPVDPETLKP